MGRARQGQRKRLPARQGTDERGPLGCAAASRRAAALIRIRRCHGLESCKLCCCWNLAPAGPPAGEASTANGRVCAVRLMRRPWPLACLRETLCPYVGCDGRSRPRDSCCHGETSQSERVQVQVRVCGRNHHLVSVFGTSFHPLLRIPEPRCPAGTPRPEAAADSHE